MPCPTTTAGHLPRGAVVRRLRAGAGGDAADARGQLGRELVRAGPLFGGELHRAAGRGREERGLRGDLFRVKAAGARGRHQIPRQDARVLGALGALDPAERLALRLRVLFSSSPPELLDPGAVAPL